MSAHEAGSEEGLEVIEKIVAFDGLEDETTPQSRTPEPAVRKAVYPRDDEEAVLHSEHLRPALDEEPKRRR